MDDDGLRLDRQVCFPLYAASNLLTRMYRPALSELGLTYPQYLVMLVLWEREPQTVGALGARLYLDSGTLTPLLKRMEAAGLLKRERDRDDERRVQVTLTAQGHALQKAARRVPETLSAGLRIVEVEALRDSVRDLVAILAAYSSPPEDQTPKEPSVGLAS